MVIMRARQGHQLGGQVGGNLVSYDRLLLTVLVHGSMVHHPGEAGAGLGGRLVDALPESLESKQDHVVRI